MKHNIGKPITNLIFPLDNNLYHDLTKNINSKIKISLLDLLSNTNVQVRNMYNMSMIIHHGLNELNELNK